MSNLPNFDSDKPPPPTLVEPSPNHYLNRDRETISLLNARIEKM